jgi:hypothetical protein
MAFTDRLHNRGSISTGYDIDNSVKLEDDNDEWLYRTNASGTNRKTWTVSWWFKQTELRSVNGAAAEHWQGGAYGEATRAGIFADDRIWIDIGGGDGNTGTLFRSLSTQKIRDTSAWYHIVIACDSTQSTEADRLKVWLNGVEVTAWDQKQYPTLNYQSALQGTGGVQMKWGSADATYHGYSGYLAECNYVDGVTATQNDFGEFDDNSGIWKPKEYTGSYGTNGSYLDFKIASDLGGNAKGNDVNFSLNNITAADQATDTPTNNFCTLNPNSALPNSSVYMTVSEGGTLAQKSGGANWTNVKGSIGIKRGKWYWEATRTGTNNTAFGIVRSSDTTYGNASTQFSLLSNGRLYGAGTSPYLTSPPAFSFTDGDILAIALDLDNQRAYLSKNGVWQNSSDPANGTNPVNLSLPDEFMLPWTASYYSEPSMKYNFGGYTVATISSGNSDENGYGNFEYAPPSGYYALCTKNLAEYG